MVIPKNKNNLEFKKVNKRRNETLEEATIKALKQIEDRKYNIEMKEMGIERVLNLGIAFDGKKVMIKEREHIIHVLENVKKTKANSNK